jgi:hypothetical protein
MPRTATETLRGLADKWAREAAERGDRDAVRALQGDVGQVAVEPGSALRRLRLEPEDDQPWRSGVAA